MKVQCDITYNNRDTEMVICNVKCTICNVQYPCCYNIYVGKGIANKPKMYLPITN